MNKNIFYGNPCTGACLFPRLRRLFEGEGVITYFFPTMARVVFSRALLESIARMLRPHRLRDSYITNLLSLYLVNWENDRINNPLVSDNARTNLQNFLARFINSLGDNNPSQAIDDFIFRNHQATGVYIWIDTERDLNEQDPMEPWDDQIQIDLF